MTAEPFPSSTQQRIQEPVTSRTQKAGGRKAARRLIRVIKSAVSEPTRREWLRRLITTQPLSS